MATRKKKETAKKAEPKVPIEVKTDRPGDPTTMGWKLAQVLGEIHSIPKEGINDHYGYKYVLEDTLTNQIRPILARWGISLVFGAEKVEDLDGQGQGYWTRVWCRFTLFDSDGHEFSVLCPGEGTDSKHPDKALYKAMTGSTKYFLYKTFLVSTGDEPERDDSPDTTLKKQKQSVQDKTKTPPTQDSTAPDMMTSDQRERLEELAKDNNNFTEQLVKVLAKILDEGGTEGSAKRIIAECDRQNKELQEHKEQQTNGEDQSQVAAGLTEEENEEDIPF